MQSVLIAVIKLTVVRFGHVAIVAASTAKNAIQVMGLVRNAEVSK